MCVSLRNSKLPLPFLLPLLPNMLFHYLIGFLITIIKYVGRRKRDGDNGWEQQHAGVRWSSDQGGYRSGDQLPGQCWHLLGVVRIWVVIFFSPLQDKTRLRILSYSTIDSIRYRKGANDLIFFKCIFSNLVLIKRRHN